MYFSTTVIYSVVFSFKLEFIICLQIWKTSIPMLAFVFFTLLPSPSIHPLLSFWTYSLRPGSWKTTVGLIWLITGGSATSTRRSSRNPCGGKKGTTFLGAKKEWLPAFFAESTGGNLKNHLVNLWYLY